MTWRVIIRPNAETDLREAWTWYESQRAGLGDELLIEIRAAIRQLETDPERRPFYYRDFRRLRTCRFAWGDSANSTAITAIRIGAVIVGCRLFQRTSECGLQLIGCMTRLNYLAGSKIRNPSLRRVLTLPNLEGLLGEFARQAFEKTLN